MIQRRELFIIVIGTLVFVSAAYADMVQVSRLDAGLSQSPYVCGRTDFQYQFTNLSNPSNCPSVADLDLWSVTLSLEANADINKTSEIQHPKILTDGTGSFSLCLWALMGLGLCRTAPWVKKLSFGFIPEWYHNGGPFQVGHSYAATPESLCPVLVCCFIQPVCTVEDSLPQNRLRTVVSLWRKSQFTPAVIAARGPPNLPNEVFHS
jgi:hypothetical protein